MSFQIEGCHQGPFEKKKLLLNLQKPEAGDICLPGKIKINHIKIKIINNKKILCDSLSSH